MPPSIIQRAWRGIRRPCAVLVASAALLSSSLAVAPAAHQAHAAPAAEGQPSVSYRLVDTWQHQPWVLTAGRYGQVNDVSSAPDGSIFVLDMQSNAVHVLAPDGTPRSVFLVPESFGDSAEWQPRRLDVGADGNVYIVVEGDRQDGELYRTRIERMSPTGVLENSFEVHANVSHAYVDIAVRSDGRIYLSRMGPGNPYIDWPGPTPTPLADGTPNTAVEVYSNDGAHLATLAPPELGVPGSLDMAADGTLYVINRVPTPWNTDPTEPTPTPRPSVLGAQAQEQSPGPVEGVLIFDPDHRVVETVPFSNAEDVAVGASGVFLSRNVEIYALRDPDPLYTGPTARIYAAYYERIALSLDVHADGRLLAGLNHCYFQGVVSFAAPPRRPLQPSYIGANDAPFLEGPPYPLRLSASDEVVALQGRYFGSGFPPDRTYAASDYLVDPQTVQRWTRQGQPVGGTRLRSQLGVCSGLDSWWTRDVAVDGTDVFTVDPNLVQYRPDDSLPVWTAWPGADLDPDRQSALSAVDARDGKVVVLDTGAAMVHVLDRTGVLLDSWPLDIGADNALPSDIALGNDRVFLADLGRSMIAVYALDGAKIGEFPTHDGPASIDTGPDGSLFVLGRGGWGFRYTPDGTLLAMWPLPDRSVEALDLAVDVDGNVYVSYAQTTSLGPPTVGRAIVLFDIDDAGIWVFAPYDTAPLAPADPEACAARVDKTADPTRLLLGSQTEVRLQVDGRCPGHYDPVQLVVVLDGSRSMNFDHAMDRARDALAVVLEHLDPQAAEVGLVTFEEGARLVVPLTRNVAQVASKVGAQQAWGDTRLAAGLELAHQQLLPPSGNPQARRIVLIVSDGIFNDDPLPVADAVRADGIEIAALILPTYEFAPDRQDALDLVTGHGSVMVDPDPPSLVALVDGMIRYRGETGLFHDITVDDVVPANMRYVVGSAVPPALWDAGPRTLTWTFENVSADRPIELVYRLEPLEVGTWPTNVRAIGSYIDVLGTPGQLPFPVPTVEVYTLGHWAVYLPFGAARSCFRSPKPVDLVLVLDTSSSMAELADGGSGTSTQTKLDAARSAASTLLGLLRWPRDRGAVVSFDRAARTNAGLTGDPAILERALAGLAITPNTHIDLGLAQARTVLADRRSTATGVVVLLTDGQNNAGRAPVLAQADALRADGILVYTVGLGMDADAQVLRSAATSPDGFFFSPTAADLEAIYRQVASHMACDQQ